MIARILQKTSVILALVAILSPAPFLSCKKIDKTSRIQVARDGLADLSHIDLEKNGPVILNGCWDFAWMRENATVPDPDRNGWETITVPSYWNDLTGTGAGSGWYRLRVKVSASDARKGLALYLKGANTAHTCYVNGKELMKSGIAGGTAADSRPLLKPVMRRLPASGPGGEYVITVKVSNFHHRGGGMNKSPVIGTHDDIENSLWKNDLLDTIALGFILLIFIFHILQWVMRRNESTNLFFALMCLAVFIHTAAKENFIERTFPLLDVYSLRFALEYAALPFSWTFATAYVWKLFPREVPLTAVRAITAAAVVTIIVTLASPATIFSRIIILYVIQIAGAALVVMPCVFLATIRRREDASLLFVGLLLLLLTVANDILFNFDVIGTGFMSQFGMCFLMVIQSLIISLRTSRAQRTAEHLSAHLQDEVVEKTRELKRQTDEAIASRTESESMYRRLDEVHTQMEYELDMARNIQQSILPRNVESIQECRILTVYRPLMVIGGDVYDIHSGSDGIVRVFLADAIGHGISASLFTLLIKSEYDRLKTRTHDPHDILSMLNHSFHNTYHDVKISFTGIIIDIDVRRGHFTYSSAGHPSQYIIRRSGASTIPHTCRSIGAWDSIGGSSGSGACAPGDVILLFTDGIYELFNSSGEQYGMERLDSIIGDIGLKPVDEIMRMIQASLTRFADGTAQSDDITAIGIQILPVDQGA